MAHKWELSSKTQDALTAASAAMAEAKEALDAAHLLLKDEIEDHRNEHGGMSERWQEGDKGAAVDEWIDVMDEIADVLESASDQLDSTIESADSYEPAQF